MTKAQCDEILRAEYDRIQKYLVLYSSYITHKPTTKSVLFDFDDTPQVDWYTSILKRLRKKTLLYKLKKLMGFKR